MQSKPQRRRKYWGFTSAEFTILVVMAVVICFALAGATGVILYIARTPAIVVSTPVAISQSTPTNTPVPPLPTDTPKPFTGKWTIKTSKSSLDDSTTVVLKLAAEKSITGWIDTYTPVIFLRCQEHETDAYVYVGMQANVESGMTDRATARVRFDKDPAIWIVMAESTDGKGLFFRDSVSTIRDMLEHEQMIFSFTPFNASPVETTFDLRGLDLVITPLQDACGWK